MDAREIVERHVVEAPPEEGERVDRWASRFFLRLPTRGSARKATKRGELLLNGAPVESSRFVKVGDVVELTASEARHPVFDLEPRVVYADPRCAIVYKPPGLLVNGNRHRTLEHALPNVLPLSSEPDALAAPRPVHRLDFETAGLVAVARCRRVQAVWGQAFAERRVQKRYRAIVLGRIDAPGRVELELDGRPAVSRYSPVEAFHSLKTEWCTLVDLVPETGRMHQLRRHMQSVGHPILGDHRYCREDGLVFRRAGLFLAAVELTLPDPDDADAAIHATAPMPYKFTSFHQREMRRWDRWHAKTPGEKEP